MAIIERTIDGAEAEVKRLTQKLQARELEAQPGRSMMESFENQVNQVLNKARDDAGRQAQASLKDTNNVVRMVTAGSKGSFINISQMIACVGKLMERERVFSFCRFSPTKASEARVFDRPPTQTGRPRKKKSTSAAVLRRPSPSSLWQEREEKRERKKKRKRKKKPKRKTHNKLDLLFQHKINHSSGQQNVEGKRIPFGFAGRTLPHFTKDDLGPESRGFVSNSYLSGLTPQELFFHAMGGREGLIDTAVKTSSTGYIQRRLVKAMEDYSIRYDGTVRDAAGAVVQFLYGEDGMDGSRVEGTSLDVLRMREGAFRSAFKFELDDPAWAPAWLPASTLESLRASVAARRALDAEYAQLCEDLAVLRTEVLRAGDASVVLPINLKRLIWNAQQAFGCGAGGGGGSASGASAGDGTRASAASSSSTLDPLDVVKRVRDLCESRLRVVDGDDPLSREAQRNATLLTCCLLRSTLAAKRVLREHRLSPDALEWLVGEIEARFFAAVAHPGEVVGTVAAQSIGEPTTQMTLNTFHFAGVSAKNVTLGVPRLTEIINVSKSIKTPSLSVYLAGDAARDREAAKAVQCALEHTTLRRVAAAAEVHYDPDPAATVIAEDREFVAAYFEMPDEELDVRRMSPWLLRIELNREMMVDKKLSMADVAERINAEFEDELSCIFNDDNADKLVLRIRILSDEGAIDKDGFAASVSEHDDGKGFGGEGMGERREVGEGESKEHERASERARAERSATAVSKKQEKTDRAHTPSKTLSPPP